MAGSLKPAEQVLAAIPSDANAIAIAREFVGEGYGVAEGGFVDGWPVPSRRMQQNGSPVGGRTVGSDKDIVRHISPTASVLIIRGPDGKAFTADLRRRVVVPLQSRQVVGAGDQFADTPQPLEPAELIEATSIVPFQSSDTALALVVSILEEKKRAEAEVVAIGAHRVRLSREQASEIKAAHTSRSRMQQADTNALIEGVEYDAPRAEKAKLLASERKIAAFPAAIKSVIEKQAIKESEVQSIKSRLTAAAMELTGSRRDEIRKRLCLKISELAEDLSALFAVELLQQNVVGEAFQFSATVRPDLWSGQVVALAFAKAIPDRLRSPQVAPAEITAGATTMFIKQKEELSL